MRIIKSKLFRIILITVIIIIGAFSLCYADQLINPTDYQPNPTESSTFNTKVGKIVGIIRAIGTVVSVVTLAILGIKYMIGGVEEKAGYKKSMLPYLIGAILLFATTTIVDILYQFGVNLNK